MIDKKGFETEAELKYLSFMNGMMHTFKGVLIHHISFCFHYYQEWCSLLVIAGSHLFFGSVDYS